MEDSRPIKRRIGWPLNFSSSGAASYQEAASRREEGQMKQVEESRQHFLLAGMLKRRKLSRSAGTCLANRCPSFGWPPAPSSPTSQNKYIHPHSSTWSLSIYMIHFSLFGHGYIYFFIKKNSFSFLMSKNFYSDETSPGECSAGQFHFRPMLCTVRAHDMGPDQYSVKRSCVSC